MIAEIRKYTFLVHHRDYENLLKSLYEAGVMHIVEKRKFDESSAINEDIALLDRYKSAIKHLSRLIQSDKMSVETEDPYEVLSEYESSVKEIEDIKNRLEKLKSEALRVEPWGNFDDDTFKKLQGSGWTLSLYSCPQKSFKEDWNNEHSIEIIGRKAGLVYFAIIHRNDGIPEIDVYTEKIPDRPASSVNAEIELYESRSAAITAKLNSMTPVWLKALSEGTLSLINKIEYAGTAEQADKYADNNIYVLEGWAPVSEEKKLEEVIENSDCYSFVSEPEPGERIPVILRNSRFSSMFEPISKMFALPDYKELDLTPFFAPFFMMFFGFCLGDAGYGLLFVVAGFFIKRKAKKELRPIITLSQYFGVAAVLFGLISGTFFGINLIDSGYTLTQSSVARMQDADVPGNIIYSLDEIKDQKFRTKESFTREAASIVGEEDFSAYRQIIIKSAESDLPMVGSIRRFMLDPMNMFYLAIILGGLQIIFGMILRIVNIARVKGFKYSLSTIGWVILALTLIIFKGGSSVNLIDEEKFTVLFKLLLIIAGILIFLFNTPHLNIFGRIGSGLWESYSIITGVFGDILSYIRLFALGISSSILGFVFNQISLQLLSVPYVGWLLFALLLLFGHSLNLAIATLGSFVHPMRLTFVEFYKNAGFKGGGIEYKPFRIKK
jgi:V/A-type H+-transporting ATPase subunit I